MDRLRRAELSIGDRHELAGNLEFLSDCITGFTTLHSDHEHLPECL